MCFSAAASYTAAAVLTVIGFVCIKKVQKPAHLFLAFTPLIFAFQQMMEGILWTSTNEITDFVRWAPTVRNIYLGIALFVWPVWIPLTLWAIETIPWRNWVLGAFFLLGCAYSIVLGYEFIVVHRWHGVDVRVLDHSIQYVLPFEFGWLFSGLYVLLTVVPQFLSSWRYMWVLGLLYFASLLISNFIFEMTFISVWCFFAAIISMGIYFVMRNRSSET